jgi:YD repeat-containing protein
MNETGQIAPPVAIQPESGKFLPRLLVWSTVILALAAVIVVAFAMMNQEWLAMYMERHHTMATPGGARKAPNPALLAKFPVLPTGWHGTPIAFFSGQPAPHRWSVDLSSGAFTHVQTDIYLPDVVPINLSRTYSSFDYEDRDLGLGASASYEFFLSGDNTVFSYIDIDFPGGSIVHMPRISPGTSYNATYGHRAMAGDTSATFDQARLWWHAPWYCSSLRDGTGIVFPASRWATGWGQRAAIMIQDGKGNVLDIIRDVAGNLVEIKSPNGQRLALGHDSSNRITTADNFHGYIIYYSYDDSGRLNKVIDSNGESTEYSYDVDDNMQSIRQPDGRIWLSSLYDKRHRVIEQTYLDGGHARYRYTPPDPSGVKVTEVTRPDGSIDRYRFNSESRLIDHTKLPPTTRTQ